MKKCSITLKKFILNLLGSISFAAAMEAPEIFEERTVSSVCSQEKSSELPLLPRSLFAFTMKGQLNEEKRKLLEQITENTGLSPYKILSHDEDNNFVVFKTREAEGDRHFVYNTDLKTCHFIGANILEGPHPYIHIEAVAPDTIYWSVYPVNNPREKELYAFSLKDQTNTRLEVPARLFKILAERNGTLYSLVSAESFEENEEAEFAIYTKQPNCPWEKIIGGNQERFAIFTKIPIIENPILGTLGRLEKKYAIYASYRNLQGQVITGPITMADNKFVPLFTLPEGNIHDLRLISYNIPTNKTKSYLSHHMLLVSLIDQGRLKWHTLNLGNGEIDIPSPLTELSNLLESHKIVEAGDNYYIDATLEGFNIIQSDHPALRITFNLSTDEDSGAPITQWGIPAPNDLSGQIQDLVDAKKCGHLTKAYYETISMQDGQPLDCIVTPPSFGTAPYPGVIISHGGPHVALNLNYNPLAQFLANRGYVVIEPVFSGSDNSQAIYERGRGQYGNLIQREMKEAANWYAHKQLIDAQRVGIIGSSFGGYVVNFQATHPDCFEEIFPEGFKCFISIVGMSDLIFDINNAISHLPRKNLISIERRARYIEPLIESLDDLLSPEAETSLKSKSPLYAAAKVKAPLLLLHNDGDERVPIYHSNALSQALSDHNIAHIYGVFKGEGHTLSNNSNLNVEYGLIENFLSKHLGGTRYQPLTKEECSQSTFEIIQGQELIDELLEGQVTEEK
ncbi:alpha/beta hydrolase family protein [Candidatus Odyssella thessalonicensis]|uniref:alpha/beta hydrolase family protein n=1 Tax=Candidatus Odyssella thessalonicensis TaxID=84647 RepID=UPI000225B71B|nr:prolyl oligopeptidase family serine peptidase [Candidatus Odyssella thessalonicensis]